MKVKKQSTEQSVLDASLDRVRTLYDRFDKVVVSFSGGKDSTTVLNVTLAVAHERGKLPLDVYFVDEEACTPETVEYVERVRARDDIALKWVCLPIKHRNACSREQTWWHCWHEPDRERWIRELPEGALTVKDVPGFRMGMKLHDLGPILYGPEHGTVADLTGIRAQESPRRLQTVTKREKDNYISDARLGYYYNCKPIYDWLVEDVWVAAAELGWDYNATYDIQAMLGTSTGMQRVTPPYGEEPLNGIWKFKEGWPDLWDKMLQRVEGVNTAGYYSLTELYGAALKEPPPGMTWQDWTMSLLDLYQPGERAEIAKNIAACIKVHQKKTKRPIPDDQYDFHSGLSWKSIAQMVCRGDLKGRKKGQMVQRAMDTMARMGLTYEEVLRMEQDENGSL